MNRKKRDPLCWKCGVEMEYRENFVGHGYCYVCADQFGIDKTTQAIREAE